MDDDAIVGEYSLFLASCPIDSDQSVAADILYERQQAQSPHWEERFPLAGSVIGDGPFEEGLPDDLWVFRRRGGKGPVKYELLLGDGELIVGTVFHPNDDPSGSAWGWIYRLAELDPKKVAAWRLMDSAETQEGPS